MYEELTSFLPKFQGVHFGNWITDNENDGSPEHPIQLPFVIYSQVVREFEDAVCSFMDRCKPIGQAHYGNILEKANIQWNFVSMCEADVSLLDGSTVMALIIAAIRAERFCDGALLDFLKKGCINKWLTRLRQIDEQ